MGMRPEQVRGLTYHSRHGAIKNDFRYCEMSDAIKVPFLFSHNGRNLTALHDNDHGGAPSAGRGVCWVYEILEARGLGRLRGGRVLLLAQPRVFGHVFNPVSFWFVHNAEDRLCLVIAEVNNTFGDRHAYLCHHADLSEILPSDQLHAQKIFHVSPFQPITGEYTFRFDVTDARVGINIDYRSADGGVLATLHGKRRQMTNLGIVQTMLARPAASLRVLALIHFQALKLWRKGAKFRGRPVAPETEIS
jgi:DUF1365 family protein